MSFLGRTGSPIKDLCCELSRRLGFHCEHKLQICEPSRKNRLPKAMIRARIG